MTVYDNMAYGLRNAKVPKDEIERRVQKAAGILELGGLLERKPRQLSGGQRQRVAMGRAIVRQPQVFLFDEPLSNLDAKLRAQTRLEIQKLHRELGITALYGAYRWQGLCMEIHGANHLCGQLIRQVLPLQKVARLNN
jgi:sn-glycerol 3-phosphate transport system ATP-binding protein